MRGIESSPAMSRAAPVVWRSEGLEGMPVPTLIAGVGYTCLRDLSFGPVLVDRLKSLPWPQGVEIEDLSYSPVAVLQKFTDKRPDKLILVGAVKRGREPGTISRYRPDGPLPDEEEIQARIGEGVTGVVSLESLLVVCRFFEVLPEDVVVLEVEPEDESWGEGFTPGVEKAVEQVIQMVREEVRALEDG